MNIANLSNNTLQLIINFIPNEDSYNLLSTSKTLYNKINQMIIDNDKPYIVYK